MAPKRGQYYSNQNYEEIKRKCLANGELWEDSEFPAVDSSIFYSKMPPKKFEWKRPGEIVSDPQLFVGGASRFDIAQGELGDCWFLAAIASLSMHEKLMYRVVPPNQSFQQDYAGIFIFQFWRFGKWVTVCVDDRLPTYNGRLVFLHSKENNEFWSALLEKAYSKMHGSYEALKGGTTVEAMEDFTGGCAELYDLRGKQPKNLFSILKTGMDKCSLLGCSINADPRQVEARLSNGLIMGHAYSITGLKKVTVNTRRGQLPVCLVRVRNPWGQVEWNGPWSDDAGEWDYITKEEREQLGLVSQDDGEFWMQWEDFVKEYERVEIVNLTPDDITNAMSKGKNWVTNSNDLRWQKGLTAGGCRNFPDTFYINPQVKVVLEEEDDDDPDDDDEGCSCVVAVMQKDRRRQRKLGKEMLTIGFAIYQIDENTPVPLPKDYFLYHASKARSNTFVNSREISGRFKLPKGHYVIVPSTFDPGEDGDFLIRVFSVKESKAQDVDEETGTVDVTGPEKAHSGRSAASRHQPTGRHSTGRPLTEAEKAQEEKFKEFFYRLTGPDMEVDAWELREILNAALKKDLKGEGFTVESCKSMVALFDDDGSGKLGFDEFKGLWGDIRSWKMIFKTYDKDNSGSFNAYELREALRSVGFRLSFKAISSMVLRYSEKDGKIDFDNFIHCAIKLKGMFKAFNAHDSGRTGTTKFGIDDFIQTTMYS
ncbi:calpain-3-like isoform X2 [Ptychodera flava]|uniref:calpain-3-like isoform X2 n=1 Tax=Ptychodera flava TaxID=63121 RepID=UPI003969C3A6